ncbi:HPP family protein [Reichenbachiella carrageenanivorans]|uniref:HPP family protein n=1 Tax=Reichenbachiella carrageenanivorans TaxID=2979869 RepID=A0ABY6D0R5_9BACT|nr:HPP family protein [Reichenbachiella carrageenanivorans]UXX79294.1 HPP family protein [Reichenbachiella carrageenanivorans]
MTNHSVYRKAKYIIYKRTVVRPTDLIWSFIGGFIGIGLIGYIQSLSFNQLENTFLVGSFGASAVLLYGATNSPLSQPRNLVGGHLVSATVGVSIAYCISSPELHWLACALAVGLAIVGMLITKTVHPPGGATALIANIGSEKIKSLGYMYVLNPILTGTIILLVVALIFNNLPKNRSYPYKWKKKSGHLPT